MNDFTYSLPTKTYFGSGAAEEALAAELTHVGKTVMLAYGGGSIRANGIYDEICGLLKAAGKDIVEFGGIMPNPTYAKAQQGAALARSGRRLYLGRGRWQCYRLLQGCVRSGHA